MSACVRFMAAGELVTVRGLLVSLLVPHWNFHE